MFAILCVCNLLADLLVCVCDFECKFDHKCECVCDLFPISPLVLLVAWRHD